VRFTVILKAARSILPEDLHLGICLLTALKDISQAKELFLQLPRSIVTLQTAAFYFALKVCIEELPPDDMNVRVNASCADPFKVFPRHFCPCIFSLIRFFRAADSLGGPGQAAQLHAHGDEQRGEEVARLFYCAAGRVFANAATTELGLRCRPPALLSR
jgi:hypothetical protein